MAAETRPGRVVLLVGPSSVGKTAIARETQRSLGGPCLVAGVDMFWGMVDEGALPAGVFRTDSDAMRRITRGWHRAVAALAREGSDVIVDELYVHDWWLADWREALRDVRWWSVLLKASHDVLSARERQRGDRPIGLARADLAYAPPEASFDLVIDTDEKTPAECAAAVAGIMRSSSRR